MCIRDSRRAAGHVTGRVEADADDPPGRRLVIEHGVELDHAVDVGQGDVERVADGLQHLAREPAVDGLGLVQQGQKGVAAATPVFGQYRLDGRHVDRCGLHHPCTSLVTSDSPFSGCGSVII